MKFTSLSRMIVVVVLSLSLNSLYGVGDYVGMFKVTEGAKKVFEEFLPYKIEKIKPFINKIVNCEFENEGDFFLAINTFIESFFSCFEDFLELKRDKYIEIDDLLPVIFDAYCAQSIFSILTANISAGKPGCDVSSIIEKEKFGLLNNLMKKAEKKWNWTHERLLKEIAEAIDGNQDFIMASLKDLGIPVDVEEFRYVFNDIQKGRF